MPHKNPERRREYKQRWRRKNKAQISAYQHSWYLQNRDRAQQIRARYNAKVRLKVLQHYSGKEVPECVCCGETTFEFLALDHVNGGGNKWRQEFGKSLSYLIKFGFPTDFQVLCHNCNTAKALYGGCPHKLEKTFLERLSIQSSIG